MKSIHYLPNRYLSLLLIFVTLIAVGLWSRMHSFYGLHSDKARQHAYTFVTNQMRQHMHQQVEKKHPTLSKAKKNALKIQLYQQESQHHKQAIQKRIDGLAKHIDQSTSQRYRYLQGSGSYYHLDLTAHILEEGQLNRPRKGHKYLNPKILAPAGQWEPLNLHPYIGAFTYQIISRIMPNGDLMTAVSSVSPILFCLTIIIFLWCLYPLKINPIATFISGLFFICAPIYFQRSMWGWYDTDPYHVLFPTLIFGSLIRIFLAKGIRQQIVWSTVTGMSFILYALFWQGWVYLFGCICLTMVITLPWTKQDQSNLSNVIPLLVMMLTTLTGVVIYFGFAQFHAFFQEAWQAFQNFSKPQLANWPNLYVTIGEFKQPTLRQFQYLMGDWPLMLWAGIGMISSVWIIRAPSNYRLAYNVNIFIVLLSSALLSLILIRSGLRFILLSLTPLSILAAIGLNFMFLISLAKPYFWKRIALVLLSVTFIIWPIHHLRIHLKNYTYNVLYNDTWHSALTKIKQLTPKNSIINSWWPPGHFIKATADRAITLDSASLDAPQAYWLAKTLITSDEKLALGILYMLNTSANAAAEYLLNITDWPLSKIVNTIESVLIQPKFKAMMMLKALLRNEKQAIQLSSFTHSSAPPNSYILLYNQMIANQKQFPLFGNWNFKVIEEINADPLKLKNIPSPKNDRQNHLDFLWKLAGKKTMHLGPFNQVVADANQWEFTEGITINPNLKRVDVQSKKYGIGRPVSLILHHDGQVQEHIQPNPTLGFSVLLTPEPTPKAFIMSRQLANALFIRLYYYKGKGMNHIQHLFTEKDLNGWTEIQVYKIDWDGFLESL